MSDPCPMCSASWRNKAAECICGGTGKLTDAFRHLQEIWAREHAELEETKDSLRSLQRSVLGFISNPQFQKMDRCGICRRYWEDKLEIRVCFPSPSSHERRFDKAYKLESPFKGKG